MKDITACARLFLLLLAPFSLFSQKYTQDLTIGPRGYLLSNVGQTQETVAGMVVSDNGTITLAGKIVNEDRIVPPLPVLQRLLPTGAMDVLFGRNGVLTLPTLYGFDVMAVQHDAKGALLLAGTHFGNNQSFSGDFCVVRLLNTGILDRQFGKEGVSRVDVQVGGDDRLMAMTQDSYGRIIAVGRSRRNGNHLVMVRWNANGQLDTTFAQKGRAIHTTPDLRASLYSVTTFPNGVVTAGGYENNRSLMWQLTPTGNNMIPFGQNGIWSNQLYADASTEYIAALKTNGNSQLMAGVVVAKVDTQWVTWTQFNAWGERDVQFNARGATKVQLPGEFVAPLAIQRQTDGKWIVSANCQPRSEGQSGVIMARFLASGLPDTSFGKKGVRRLTTSTHQILGSASLLTQADGSIWQAVTTISDAHAQNFAALHLSANGRDSLVTGNTLLGQDLNIGRDYSPTLHRLAGNRTLLTQVLAYGPHEAVGLRIINPDGSFDTDFGDNGLCMLPEATSVETLVQPDGGLLLSLTASEALGWGMDSSTIIRLLPNGQHDSSFSPLGSGAFEGTFGALALQPNGQILAFTKALIKGEWRYGLTRLKANGSIDTTFGEGGKALYALPVPIGKDAKIAVLPNGLIVVGCTIGEAKHDFGFMLFTAAGLLLSYVNPSGLVNVDFKGGDDRLLGIQVDPIEQTFTLLGTATDSLGHIGIGMARFFSGGSFDHRFASKGLRLLAADERNSHYTQVNYTPDKHFLFVGQWGRDDLSPTLTKVSAMGVVDTTFAEKGVHRLVYGQPFYGKENKGSALLLTDGNLLWADNTLNGDNEDIAILRLKPQIPTCDSFSIRTLMGTPLAEGRLMVRNGTTNGCTPVSPLLRCGRVPVCFCPNAVDTITAYSISAPYDGLSTFDIVLISQHLLNLRRITDPYQLLAADVNVSNTVTSFDVVELRKFILGVTDSLPRTWRFVDAAHVFLSPDNPFAAPVPSFVRSVSAGRTLLAIKVGDVNRDYQPICDNTRQNGVGLRTAATLQTFSRAPNASSVVTTVPLQVTQRSHWVAWQGTFQYDAAQFDLTRIDHNYEGTFDYFDDGKGLVRMLWYEPTGQPKLFDLEKPLAVLVFTRKQPSASASVPLVTLAQKTSLFSAGFDVSGQAYPFAMEQVQETNSLPKLEVMPNPTAGTAIWEGHMPQAGTGQLRIFDAAGRLCWQEILHWEAGTYRHTVTAVAAWVAGYYTWQLHTSDGKQLHGKLLKN